MLQAATSRATSRGLGSRLWAFREGGGSFVGVAMQSHYQSTAPCPPRKMRFDTCPFSPEAT